MLGKALEVLRAWLVAEWLFEGESITSGLTVRSMVSREEKYSFTAESQPVGVEWDGVGIPFINTHVVWDLVESVNLLFVFPFATYGLRGRCRGSPGGGACLRGGKRA